MLSVQVHVPLTKAEDGHLMEKKPIAVPGASFTRLKKIDNTELEAVAPFQFDYLPRRRAVDIEFKGLTYSVSEGRKKGQLFKFAVSLIKCVVYIMISLAQRDTDAFEGKVRLHTGGFKIEL